ncbi:hypothetical protein, partial [Xanthomonas oryzae]
RADPQRRFKHLGRHPNLRVSVKPAEILPTQIFREPVFHCLSGQFLPVAATTGNTQGRVGGGTHMKPQNQTEHNIHYAKSHC